MATAKMTLDDLLEKARQALNLTWDEVAARADLSTFGIRRARKTGRMLPLTARKLEQALELAEGELEPYISKTDGSVSELTSRPTAPRPRGGGGPPRSRASQPTPNTASDDDEETVSDGDGTSDEVALFSHLVSDKKYRRFVANLPEPTVLNIHEEAIKLIQNLVDEEDEE